MNFKVINDLIKFNEDMDKKIEDAISVINKPFLDLIKSVLIGRIQELNRYYTDLVQTVDWANTVFYKAYVDNQIRKTSALSLAVLETKSWAEREITVFSDPVISDFETHISVLQSKIDTMKELFRRIRSMLGTLESLLLTNL
jgi:hypothetical protein